MNQAHIHIDLAETPLSPILERCTVHVEPKVLPRFTMDHQAIHCNGHLIPTGKSDLLFELFELFLAHGGNLLTTNDIASALDIKLVLAKQGYPRQNPHHFVLRLLTAARNLASQHLDPVIGVLKWFPYEEGGWRLYHLSSDYLSRRAAT